jgi:hypothetical protein
MFHSGAGDALIGHVIGVSAKNDAIAQRVAAQLQGLQQMAMLWHVQSPVSASLGLGRP